MTDTRKYIEVKSFLVSGKPFGVTALGAAAYYIMIINLIALVSFDVYGMVFGHTADTNDFVHKTSLCATIVLFIIFAINKRKQPQA
jgi:hypothetical protein